MADDRAVHGPTDADGLAARQDPRAAQQVPQPQLPHLETVDPTHIVRLRALVVTA